MRLILLILFIFCIQSVIGQSANLPHGSIGYYLSKAIDLSSQKQFEKAIVFTDSAMIIAPANKNVFATKAEILWMMKRFSEAADYYQQTLLLDKDENYLY